MTPAREKAKQIIDSIPNRDIRSSGPDAKIFLDMTGTAHKVMQDNWNNGGIMTAYNGWTGTFSTKLGRGGLGVFDLASVAGGAWVACDGSVKPQFGDVFRCKKLHVGVVLEYYDNHEALVIEAGQGGKSSGFDILRRSRKPFGPNEIMGWVNIDVWLDPAELEKEKLRKSLKGTWTVEVNGQKRAYVFPASGNEVSFVDKGRKVTGKWTTEGPNVAIKWTNGDSETWPMPIPPLYKAAQGIFKDAFKRVAQITYKQAW